MIRTMLSSVAVAATVSMAVSSHAVSGDVDGRDFLLWQRGGSPAKAKTNAGTQQRPHVQPCIPGGLPPKGCPPWLKNKKKGPKSGY
jgi:hypothetical protein